MRPERFFIEHAPEGANARLSRDETHHLRDVRRLDIGANVVLFDGSGTDYVGRVAAFDRAGAIIEITRVERTGNEADVAITLAVSTVKRRAMDQLVDQCTQLGVARLVPMRTERTIVRPDRNQAVRWRRIAIEACKQCGRSRLPAIEDEKPFSESLDDAAAYDVRLIASLRPGPQPPFDTVMRRPVRTALCLVGPEGGFTDAEEAAAEAAGCLPLWLGPHILRTETAAVAALVLSAWSVRSKERSDTSNEPGVPPRRHL